MGNLEHNIKEAFAGHDAKAKLADKTAVWNRLDKQMSGPKGVAAFWRIAAVLLGVFLLTGAFAALNSRAKQQTAIKKAEMENAVLLAIIDSLHSIPVAIKTEIQIVEKEKLVYREKPVVQQNSNSAKYWEHKYKELNDSAELIGASNKNKTQQIMQLSQQLTFAKLEIAKLEQASTKPTESKQEAPFQLKRERVEVGIQKKPSVKNPEMQMKVFQKNFIENRNNLNSTIFKK